MSLSAISGTLRIGLRISLENQQCLTCISAGQALFSAGVADGTRTRDSQDHNLVLYQLNYSHHCRAERRERS